MVSPAMILKEKVLKVSQIRSHPELLKGFVRLVNDKGNLKTCGFFLDEDAFSDLLESMEYTSPEFWDEIERSRRSGQVSSKTIEKRLGMR